MPSPGLPELALARSLPRRTDVLIAGYTGDTVRGLPKSVCTAFNKKYGSTVAEFAAQTGASKKKLATTALPGAGDGALLLVGLGDDEQLSAEDVRQAAGAAVRAAAGLDRSERLVLAVDDSDPDVLRAAAEGALLGSYRFRPLTSDPDKINSGGDATDSADGDGVQTITLLAPATGKPQLAAVDTARIVATAVAANREWVNQPPNLLYPESFAADAASQLSGSRVKVEVLDADALTRDGYGGLLAVGGGSERTPRLVRMRYAPRGAKTHLALVGKGITFDSGGLDIKPPSGMLIMKSDMSGAAAVIAATHAIAQLGLKIKITSYAALAENMPSGSAYRPSDVITMYGGKTVENFNTDAEGRLVMADALSRAVEDQPDLIVDVATLTGACIIALGERTGGVLSNDQQLADRVLGAAEAAGERFWQLPIPAESREHLDSDVADLKSGRSGPGGALTAAAFLREFVGDTGWAHLDIAGPSYHDGKPYGYVGSGGTGIGVRTLIRLAEQTARSPH